KDKNDRWTDHAFRRGDLIEKFISDKNKDGCNVYFCPHGFNKKSRTKECAALPRLLYADLDEADPRDIAIRPTIAWESSPDRYAAIWMIDREMTEDLNRRMTYAMGADNGGWDLTQVLRIPGSVNFKYEPAASGRLMWQSGPTYSVTDLNRRLPRAAIPKTA